MNYHIIPQDKFFNTYIEDIYKIHEEANNVILVRGNKGDTPFLTTSRPVEYLGYQEVHILDRLRSITKEDKLFVSGYEMSIARLILKSEVPCKLYVYNMGYEFYCDPVGYHDKWLFDTKTRRYVKRNMRFHSIFAKAFRTWYKLPIYLYESYRYDREVQALYEEKLLQFARIDFIVTSKQGNREIDFIKKLYPTLRAEHAVGNFDQNIDSAKNAKVEYNYSKDKALNILLGNSATAENNHIDALPFLSKVLHKNSNIFAPLSYGEMQYAEYVESCFTKHFGDRFHALRGFMKIDEYLKLLCSMDIAVMFHNRQQAYGNICTMLALGKPIFMKSNSVVFDQLKRMGIEDIYDVRTLPNADLAEVTAKAFANREKNIRILSECHSEATRLEHLKKLLLT